MSTPKPTQSRDGTPRISLRVSHRLSAYDVAVHLVHSRFAEGDDFIEDLDTETYKARIWNASLNKILDTVRENLRCHGNENPFYAVSEYGLDEYVDASVVALWKSHGFGDES